MKLTPEMIAANPALYADKKVGDEVAVALSQAVPAEEKVAVPKSLLEQILQGQKELEAKVTDLGSQVAERDRTIEKLTYAADKNRMGIWEERNAAGDIIRTVTIGSWLYKFPDSEKTEQRFVMATQLIQDEVMIEDNGGVRRLVERQTLRVFLDDGVDADNKMKFVTVDVPYVRFYQNVLRVPATVIGESKTEDGSHIRKVRFPDGKTLEIDIRFINF